MSAGSGGQPVHEHVDRNHLVHAADDGVAAPEDAAGPRAVADGDHELRVGVASYVFRRGTAMLRVTGPVTSRRSAWRGEATKCTPKRSLS